jgi:membrane protein YqaA with SNARE-associated domain
MSVVLVASFGNFFGACTGYYIGFMGRGYVEKYLRIEKNDMERTESRKVPEVSCCGISCRSNFIID